MVNLQGIAQKGQTPSEGRIQKNGFKQKEKSATAVEQITTTNKIPK
jgi:hypothetical protein